MDKPKPGTPEWMKYIQGRAAAKKAENKKIKEAEKAVSQSERQKKLALANEILNPKPAEPETPLEENVPLPKKKAAPRRALNLDEDIMPEKRSFKEEYYKRKLELLDRQQMPPPPPAPKQPLPYQIAKQDIAKHVNKTVFDSMFKEYFPDTPSPYE